MDYHKYNKKNNNSGGFSIVELLVVIGIMIIFLVLSDSIYSSFKSSSNVRIATDGLVESLRYAQANAQAVKDDAKWGVEILSDQIVVFKGDTYAGRVVSSDEPLTFPSGVVPSGSSEFIFEKMTGVTSAGTITLTNSSESQNISINAKGTITY